METVEDYINQLEEGRKKAIQKLRNVILENLPKGFEEVITRLWKLIVEFSLLLGSNGGFHHVPLC